MTSELVKNGNLLADYEIKTFTFTLYFFNFPSLTFSLQSNTQDILLRGQKIMSAAHPLPSPPGNSDEAIKVSFQHRREPSGTLRPLNEVNRQV